MCRYLANREEREEAGTPNIIGDVKMGLVMHMKQRIGEVVVSLIFVSHRDDLFICMCMKVLNSWSRVSSRHRSMLNSS